MKKVFYGVSTGSLFRIFISKLYYSFLNVTIREAFRQFYFESKRGVFEFMVMPVQGRDTKLMMRSYEHYLEKEGKQREEIYRTFKIHPLKFWKWHVYATNDLYKFKYKRPSKDIR
jgi:hypothetical protein